MKILPYAEEIMKILVGILSVSTSVCLSLCVHVYVCDFVAWAYTEEGYCSFANSMVYCVHEGVLPPNSVISSHQYLKSSILTCSILYTNILAQ